MMSTTQQTMTLGTWLSLPPRQAPPVFLQGFGVILDAMTTNKMVYLFGKGGKEAMCRYDEVMDELVTTIQE